MADDLDVRDDEAVCLTCNLTYNHYLRDCPECLMR